MMFLWMALLTTGVLGFAAFCVSAMVASQARKRGYSFIVWVVAGMLGNPLFFLVLLAIMPDFARRKQREKEMAELEKKLAARKRMRVLAGNTDILQVPTATALPAVRERSLRDEETRMLPAPERSLGDEPTRL
jgi:hypothetical protein